MDVVSNFTFFLFGMICLSITFFIAGLLRGKNEQEDLLTGFLLFFGSVGSILSLLFFALSLAYDNNVSKPDRVIEVKKVIDSGRGLTAVSSEDSEYRISLELSRKVDQGDTKCSTKGHTDNIYKCEKPD